MVLFNEGPHLIRDLGTLKSHHKQLSKLSRRSRKSAMHQTNARRRLTLLRPILPAHHHSWRPLRPQERYGQGFVSVSHVNEGVDLGQRSSQLQPVREWLGRRKRTDIVLVYRVTTTVTANAKAGAKAAMLLQKVAATITKCLDVTVSSPKNDRELERGQKAGRAGPPFRFELRCFPFSHFSYHQSSNGIPPRICLSNNDSHGGRMHFSFDKAPQPSRNVAR
jgi:hypothetical protein